MNDPRELLLALMLASGRKPSVAELQEAFDNYLGLYSQLFPAEQSEQPFEMVDISLATALSNIEQKHAGEGLIINPAKGVSVDIRFNDPNSPNTFDGTSLSFKRIRFHRFFVTSTPAKAGANLRCWIIKKWQDIIPNPLHAADRQTLGTFWTETTTELNASATFTGTGRDCDQDSYFDVSVFADVAGTLYVENSADNSTWRTVDTVSVPANTPIDRVYRRTRRYMRVRYTNGATNQGEFEIYSTLTPIG